MTAHLIILKWGYEILSILYLRRPKGVCGKGSRWSTRFQTFLYGVILPHVSSGEGGGRGAFILPYAPTFWNSIPLSERNRIPLWLCGLSVSQTDSLVGCLSTRQPTICLSDVGCLSVRQPTSLTFQTALKTRLFTEAFPAGSCPICAFDSVCRLTFGAL